MVSTGLENAILNGLVTGSFIALGAIGLSLVYNIAGVPNFAHGELLMIGAYAALLANVPWNVPLLSDFATTANPTPTPVVAILFVLTTAVTLGAMAVIGGRSAFSGAWWPIEPPSRLVAVAVHIAAALAAGTFVALIAPSIWAGFALAALTLAFLGPVLDRYLFRKFRQTDAALATILMAAMGLAFVLRFSTQTLFGGGARSYEVDQTIDLIGYSLNATHAKFIDLYVTGEGLVIELIATAPDPQETLYLAHFGWPLVAGIVLTTVAVGYGSYRWRGAGVGEHEAAQTIGPRIVGTVAGLLTLGVLTAILGSATSGVPGEAAVYATRIRTSVIRLSVVLIAVVLMTGLHVVLRETKLGTAMRAASDNLDLARITGIDTERVMMITWLIAGAFAAIGGVVIGVLFFQITPSMGFFRLLPIFAAVILGGLASIYGAIVGAFAVGIAMEVGFYLLNLLTPVSGTHRVSLAFVLLLVVLLIKPEGIVGRG